MIVLGVDPGLSLTGWGVVSCLNNSNAIRLIDYGCIRTKHNEKLVDRLKTIYSGLEEIIKKEAPEVMAVEELFFSKEARSVAR